MEKASNKENIEIIHKNLLPILEEFITFCEKNNLRYYVIGGTFLGAIRHKGFIPWDDDIDVAMPRCDYEKFLTTFKSDKGYYPINYKIDNNYKYYISKLCDPKYMIIEKTGIKTDLFIDIFPIDGMPKNKFKFKIHTSRILYRRYKLSFYYNDSIDMSKKRGKIEKVAIFLAKKIPFKKLINPTKEKQKIDKLLMKYPFDGSKYSGTIMGAYRRREIVPTEYFGKAVKYDFEKYKVNGPEKYNEYLTHMYGDYMKIPKDTEKYYHCEELIKK